MLRLSNATQACNVPVTRWNSKCRKAQKNMCAFGVVEAGFVCANDFSLNWRRREKTLSIVHWKSDCNETVFLIYLMLNNLCPKVKRAHNFSEYAFEGSLQAQINKLIFVYALCRILRKELLDGIPSNTSSLIIPLWTRGLLVFQFDDFEATSKLGVFFYKPRVAYRTGLWTDRRVMYISAWKLLRNDRCVQEKNISEVFTRPLCRFVVLRSIRSRSPNTRRSTL